MPRIPRPSHGASWRSPSAEAVTATAGGRWRTAGWLLLLLGAGLALCALAAGWAG